MANLNLSEFGEKLFVADADHTFIWDTAASISKRVSRNSWLNSGTLTSDAPVTISQTWNQIGTAFTAFKVNAVSTASASGSLLLDLQVGGVSKFNVDKSGNITSTGTNITTAANGTWGTPSAIEIVSGGHIRWASRGRLYSQTADSISILDSSASLAVTLVVEATNTLALRNGAAAQTFNVYGTWSSITDYRRLSISCAQTTGNIDITANKGSGTTGSVGAISVTASALYLTGNTYFANTAGSASWRIDSNLFPQTNNSFDLGSSSLRVKSGFFGTSVVNAGYAEHAEMTAPAAPASNSVRIYAEDNGAGKTRLMALFATGVAQQIAIEP